MRDLKHQTSIRLSERDLEIIRAIHEQYPFIAQGKREGNVSMAVSIALQAWAQAQEAQVTNVTPKT